MQWLSRILGRDEQRRGRRLSSGPRDAQGTTERLRPAAGALGADPQRFGGPGEPFRTLPREAQVSDWPAALPPLPLAAVPVPSVHARSDGPGGPRISLSAPPASELPRSELGPTRIVAVASAPSGPIVAVLIGIDGKHTGEVYKVRDGVNLVGRAKEARIFLDGRDDTVSREHAEIVHQQGRFGLKALRKTNPAWINDEDVADGAPLCDGDRIRLGQSTFRFRVA